MRMMKDRGTTGGKRSGILYFLIVLALATGIAQILFRESPQPQSHGLVINSPVGGAGMGISSEAGIGVTPVQSVPSPAARPQQSLAVPSAPAQGSVIQPAPASVTDFPCDQETVTQAPDVTEPSDAEKFLKPLGSAEPDNPDIQEESYQTLKTDLERFLSEQKGRYGLYYKNLVTGEAFGIHDKEHFIAASTTKLPMNLMLYRKVAAGEVDLNSRLTYLQEDFEAGTGIIQSSPYGTEYTVRETARLSIVYSDNCAINMIIRLLGIENIRRYMQDLGGTVYYGPGCPSCPFDLVIYAQELYRFYQEDPDLAVLLMEDLMNTQWNDRIKKLIPGDVKVAHKIGNYPGVVNDIAIVFANEPYALAVMSSGVEQDAAEMVIAELSIRIYDGLHRQ